MNSAITLQKIINLHTMKSVLTVQSFTLNSILITTILCNFNGFVTAQSILERFRPNSNLTTATDDQVKIISGTKVKRFERLTVPIGGGNYNVLQPHPSYLGLAYVRNTPLVYFPKLREFVVTHWPFYPVRVRLTKASCIMMMMYLYNLS